MEEEKIRLMKIARMQLKHKLKSIGLMKQGEEVEAEDAAPQKTKKGKDKAPKEKETNAHNANKKSRGKSNQML